MADPVVDGYVVLDNTIKGYWGRGRKFGVHVPNGPTLMSNRKVGRSDVILKEEMVPISFGSVVHFDFEAFEAG